MMTAVAGGIYGIDNKKLQLISEENKTIITKNLLLFTFNLKPKNKICDDLDELNESDLEFLIGDLDLEREESIEEFSDDNSLNK